MRIVRQITYEGPEERLRNILEHSLADGSHNFHRCLITVKTVEGEDSGMIGTVSFNPDKEGWVDGHVDLFAVPVDPELESVMLRVKEFLGANFRIVSTLDLERFFKANTDVPERIQHILFAAFDLGQAYGEVGPYTFDRPEVLRDWNLKNGMKPYAIKVDINTGQRVELISYPWWDSTPNDPDGVPGYLRVNVREPNEPTTMYTLDWPNLTLVEVEQYHEA
jgi:hypothetical protein